MRALILFLVFVGIYLFDSSRLWASPASVGEGPGRRHPLIERPFIAFVPIPFEKRAFDPTGKSYNRETAGFMPASAAFALLTFKRPSWPATRGERAAFLLFLSPPGVRAPPCD